MSDVKRDTQFVRVIITDTQGNKRTAYLYKPQKLVCTSYVTVEFLEGMGCKIEEVHNENSKN